MSTRRLSVERPAVRSRVGPGVRLAFAGAVAVGAALAVGELLGGVLPGVPSPLLGVAQFFVDYQPPGVKQLVVDLFGTADKLVFQLFIVFVGLGIGAALGRLSPKSPDLAATVLVGFTAAGFAASLREPDASVALSAGAAGAEAILGIWVLRRLVAIADVSAAGAAVAGRDARGMPDWSRRSLLQSGGAIAIGSVVAGVVGRLLLEKQRAPATAVGIPIAPIPPTLPAASGSFLEILQAIKSKRASSGGCPLVEPNFGLKARSRTSLRAAQIEDPWHSERGQSCSTWRCRSGC